MHVGPAVRDLSEKRRCGGGTYNGATPQLLKLRVTTTDMPQLVTLSSEQHTSRTRQTPLIQVTHNPRVLSQASGCPTSCMLEEPATTNLELSNLGHELLLFARHLHQKILHAQHAHNLSRVKKEKELQNAKLSRTRV